QRPNLLLLDEPTNHLDLEMRLALNQALQGYEGSVILVSHDRHLLRSVCDELWLVDRGRVQPFDQDLDFYPKWLANRKSGGDKSSVPEPPKAVQPLGRKEMKAMESRLKRLDRQI
ncbi:MAG: ABC transporter ATP-binding protein, partial [Pseudomonadota bacterium]